MTLAKEEKTKIIENFQRHKKDSGSCEVQVAVLTTRIRQLTEHFKSHPKDNHSRRGLLAMVNRRKKLLFYLKRENLESYQKLIKELDLRK